MLVAENEPFLVEEDDDLDIGEWVERINKESRSRVPEPVDAGCGFTMMDYISVLHGDNKGWIALAKKTPNWKQRHYRYADICEELIDVDLDSYMTVNTFNRPKRNEESAFELNAFYVDLDVYKTDVLPAYAIYSIKEDLIRYGEIPAPTFWIDSGNGLYLVWKIETVPGQSQKALTLYRKIQEYLVDLLAEYGADEACKDASRVLRIPGTRNSKTGRMAQIIEYNPDAVYTMRQFIDEYLPQRYHDDWFRDQYPEFPSKKKKPVKRKRTKAFAEPSSITRLKTKNTYTLHKGRIDDLLTLCNIRGWNMTGHRELTLFLLRYWTSIVENDEKATEFILEVNRKFTEPLPEHEVLQATKSADKASQAFLSDEMVEYQGKQMRHGYGYNYKNESLIRIFEITPEEQKHLSVIVGTEVKYSRNNARRRDERRNANGLTSREQQRQDMIQQVASLLSEGLKQKEIAERLGITSARVSQIKKKLNETALYIKGGSPGPVYGCLGDSILSEEPDSVALVACFESADFGGASLVTLWDSYVSTAIGRMALQEVAASDSS
ncbi:Homeodomain-like domain-containing protein [Alicyclobacillus sacchari]|uniref:Homeodomain-like domain-containing protein n=1 Tax=Alicyclobacillus sacchari TaxID=392010 RepID=A0A4R8L8A3_9BACL|nr:DNA-primase RepB domain-containing protein [Alicyclobacillus sacchari]TDY38977.1 Homeodomain-like domain-containing protein [Alicyclobacillus sacchari]